MDIWDAIHDERRSVLGTFEGLTPDQWEVPSLCGSWTVRQLLGHLIVAADPRLRHFAIESVKTAGNFDKANDRLARAEAERPTDELLARYRERLGVRFKPPGLPLAAPLSDILLHSLDLRIPLGVPTERPVERWEPVLGLLFTRRGALGFVPRGRPKLRWLASDHPWEHGTGDEVCGTMADLAAAASGRGARLEALTGTGQPALATWLQH